MGIDLEAELQKRIIHRHSVCCFQSCHIGEEDEGGEQEGEEPSFEVRQTEMVWGDQGKGGRGVSGEAAPYALSDYTMTSHSAHPPHPTLATFLFFFSFCLPFVNSHHVSISCCGGLTCACLSWTLHTSRDQYSERMFFLFCFVFSKLHDSSVEMTAAKEFKIKPR